MRSRLLRSSDDSVLDAEAVLLPRRANPIQPVDRTDPKSLIDTTSRRYRVAPHLNAFVPARSGE